MNAPACCLARIPANGKFWLRNAALDDRSPADIRIEQGRIRAVIPAGEAPCCAPGLDLDGGSVRPLAPDGRVAAEFPADLSVTLCGGRVVEMRGGHIPGLKTGN